MKAHQPGRRHSSGSFGIPPEMQEARKKFDENRAAAAGASDEMSEEEMGEEPEEDAEVSADAESETPAPKAAADQSPRKALAKLGITLTDADFHSILYRGYVEKEVEVMPAIGTVKAMVVRVKTLTPEEYNVIDELVADDLENIKGTNAGFQVRRELWTVSLAAISINGKELAKVKRDKDGEADLKDLARTRQKMLKQLSPAVINKLINVVSVMGWAISAIVEDPKANF